MKRFTVFAVWFLSLAPGILAGPQTITYQGAVSRADGRAVADGMYAMRFWLYDGPTTGIARWVETVPTVPVANGIFSTTLGESSPFGMLFNTYPNLWLQVAIDLDKNGMFAGSEVCTPRPKLTGAP